MNSFDVVIISTSNKERENYWQDRLLEMRGAITHPDAIAVAVHEGLSTLHTYRKAKIKAKKLFDVDLFELQSEGASVALYPSAEKGARLFPLTTNKSSGTPEILTVLETSILQTSIYASSRRGRLSIFSSDQLFLPTKNVPYTPQYHIDFLSKGGVNLGSFSLSTAMTFALLREFSEELGHLNTDEHFWAPLALDWKSYKLIGKGNREYFNRMQRFKEKFCTLHSDTSFLGPVSIGKDGYWWEFGSPDSYFTNLQKLTDETQEGNLMRLFFSITPSSNAQNAHHLIQDQNSILINCDIRSGRVENCILLNVNAENIEAKNCAIINSSLDTFKAQDTLIYNAQEDLYTTLTNLDK